MEGLRISVLLLGSFAAGMSTWLVFDSSVIQPQHQVAGTACEQCSACDPSLLSSR